MINHTGRLVFGQTRSGYDPCKSRTAGLAKVFGTFCGVRASKDQEGCLNNQFLPKVLSEVESMSTILQLDVSPRTDSTSNRLATLYVDGLKKKDSAAVVYHHNTTNEKLPYVNEAALGTLFAGIEPATDEQKQILVLSEKLITELLAADTIVVAVPMWNLGAPASFKAWVDLISRPGRTFNYVAGGGVETLLPAGKKVVIVSSRGGAYTEGTPWASYDQVIPYLRTLFGFFGISDITVVTIDNQNRSGDAPVEGLAAAEKQIAALLG